MRLIQPTEVGFVSLASPLEDVLKVMIDVSNILLPHPNPPLDKGRESDFLVSLLYKGPLEG